MSNNVVEEKDQKVYYRARREDGKLRDVPKGLKKFVANAMRHLKEERKRH